MEPFTFIDLFAGCGGLSLGLRAAGGEELLAIEKSEMAAMTYYHNLLERLPGNQDSSGKDEMRELWRNRLQKDDGRLKTQGDEEIRLIVADIWLVLKNEVLLEHLKNQKPDVVVGGPPCQGFSLAGLRKGNKDARNSLVHAFYQFVMATKPKFIVLENVEGIRRKFKGSSQNPIDEIVECFERGTDSNDQTQYQIQRLALNAKH